MWSSPNVPQEIRFTGICCSYGQGLYVGTGQKDQVITKSLKNDIGSSFFFFLVQTFIMKLNNVN